MYTSIDPSFVFFVFIGVIDLLGALCDKVLVILFAVLFFIFILFLFDQMIYLGQMYTKLLNLVDKNCFQRYNKLKSL